LKVKFGIALPKPLLKKVEKDAKIQGISRSQRIEEIIDYYFKFCFIGNTLEE